MNFLNFRDFFRFFLNFSKFNSIYFELNSLKYIYIYIYIYISCVYMAGDMAQIKKRAATWQRMDAPHGSVYVYTCVYMRV